MIAADTHVILMITATSIIFKAPLITADKNLIKADCVETIW